MWDDLKPEYQKYICDAMAVILENGYDVITPSPTKPALASAGPWAGFGGDGDRGARAYNGGLGRSPQRVSRGRAPG